MTLCHPVFPVNVLTLTTARRRHPHRTLNAGASATCATTIRGRKVRAMSAPLEPLGARIRRLRQERGLGQDRLAIEAKVDQSGLSKVERGKEKRFGEIQLRRIAAVLSIPYERLIDGTDFHASRT